MHVQRRYEYPPLINISSHILRAILPYTIERKRALYHYREGKDLRGRTEEQSGKALAASLGLPDPSQRRSKP